MNDQCETYEVLISTWMDEEIERGAQRELFDHFVRCEACRAFYRDARALEGLVAAASPASELAQRPSPEVWKRIEIQAAPEPPAEKRVAGLPSSRANSDR